MNEQQSQTVLTKEERDFFIERAKEYQKNDQPVTLRSTSPVTAPVNGVVLHTTQGGITIEDSTSKLEVSVLWSRIEQLIAQSKGQSKAAGSGSGS